MKPPLLDYTGRFVQFLVKKLYYIVSSASKSPLQLGTESFIKQRVSLKCHISRMIFR